MKLTYIGAISTGIVIVLSVMLIVPAFTQEPPVRSQKVMLSFSITESDSDNLPSWCNNLSSVLSKLGIKATVFVTGNIADSYPECVSVFSNNANLDIGSQTYSNAKLTTFSDYTAALQEVKKGKEAVDEAGQIDSKLFRSPDGLTDENIYSLLYRSEIIADFSYDDQYNWHDGEQFISFNLTGYDWHDDLIEVIVARNTSDIPIMINFDNSIEITDIEEFVVRLKLDNKLTIVNASDLTKTDLTGRELLV